MADRVVEDSDADQGDHPDRYAGGLRPLALIPDPEQQGRHEDDEFKHLEPEPDEGNLQRVDRFRFSSSFPQAGITRNSPRVSPIAAPTKPPIAVKYVVSETDDPRSR